MKSAMGSTDIIAAIATPSGQGGIGIVRVSGKGLQSLIHAILGYLPQPRYASLGNFLDEDGGMIDQGIAIYFPAPHSYTGEDVLELQGHGGMVIMNLLLARCMVLGARLAGPGEFTLRAFLNGRMDLAQAESVMDVISAGTGKAACCAMRSLQGEFSSEIHALVEMLIELRVLIEATLDFSEEETGLLEQTVFSNKIRFVYDRLKQLLSSARQGSRLREGLHVVLAGQPNAGKSSLMNCLTGEDTAIVTDIPGTTRDAIHRTIEIEGIPVHLTDTAGLRETADAIEKIGISRTLSAIQQADLVLLIRDVREEPDTAILGSLPDVFPRIQICNKIDLPDIPPRTEYSGNEEKIYLSAKTGAGINLLREKLLEKAGWQPAANEGVFMARSRHLFALNNAKTHLEQAMEMMDVRQSELLAEELRLTQHWLSLITGKFTTDDLLGEIFTGFCIGK